jgi:SAM-dependent methyltransferase
VFDVGAGDCRHFVELRRFLQFECAGVEINPAMAERARQGGYDVETGTLERMDISRHTGRYHIVSMNHVLEHVIDPAEVPRRALSLLRPGGTLIGQLPTRSTWERWVFGRTWAGYHYPRHLQILSRSGLARLLESNGFVNVRIKSTPHAQAALSAQNWLISRGVRSRLRFGRAPFFSALMVGSVPIELLAFCTDRSGIVDFEAERPGEAPAT